MSSIFGNIFDDEEEKKSGGTTSVVATEPTMRQSAAQGESIFGEIFSEQDDIRKEAVTQTPQSEAVEPKGFIAKAVNAGKSVVKFGLDVANKINARNEKASFPIRELYYGKSKVITDPITGDRKFTTEGLEAYEKATTDEERNKIIADARQNAPIIKFLNKNADKVTAISEGSSNLPLKLVAGLSALGDKTYEEAYGAWLTERNDPENPIWQKFLYEVQDAVPQSLLGVLLAVGTTAATRNPQAGYAVSGAFYTALSADEQIQERGQVESVGNIAIDVVGDQILNRALIGLFGAGGSSNSRILTALKGMGIEGSTEVSQSLLKYGNDYSNAQTQAEKDAVLADAKNYVINGGLLMEFGVGAVAGGIATVAVDAVAGVTNVGAIPNQPTTRPSVSQETERVPMTEPVDIELGGLDINEVRDKLSDFQRSFNPNNQTDVEIFNTMQDTLSDYATTFNDKTFYVPSGTTQSPLLEVETVKFPDGQYAVKYSVNTDRKGFSSAYDFTQLFPTQKAATEDAIKAVKAQIQTELDTNPEPEVKAQYEEILAFAEGKKKSQVREDVPVPERVEESNVVTGEQVAKELKELGTSGGVSQWLLDKVKSENYTTETVSIAELRAKDPDLDTYIKENKMRRTSKSGQGKPIVDSNNEMWDGYNRTLQAVRDGKTEIEVYKGSKKEKTTKKPVSKSQKKTKKPLVQSNIQELEKQLRDAYAATGEASLEGFTKADEMLSQITTEMELSKAGERIFLPPDATRDGSSVIGVPSTFPEWVPENLRSSDLFSKVLGSLEVSKLKYPAGNRNRQRELYQIILDELDAQLDIDTSDIRNKIMQSYEKDTTQDGDKGEAAKGDGGSTQGGKKPKKPVKPTVPEGKRELSDEIEFNIPSGTGLARRTSGETDGGMPEAGAAKLPDIMGGIKEINPIELPELVDITRELIGQVPRVKKSLGKAAGMFRHQDGLGLSSIDIIASYFEEKNLPAASKTLAHELGHLIDWLPDTTLNRGNLLGRLKSLRDFMQTTFHPDDASTFSSKDRAKVRSEVQREVMAEKGVKSAKELTAEDKATIKERYKLRVDMYIENDGYIQNETIEKELLAVTRYWHPYDPKTAPPQYVAYRESSRELYAEALSMLLVAPKRLSEMAPTFYQQFFNNLDAKPQVRDIYFETQALLSGDRELITKRRREGVKRMFKEGDYKAIELHNRLVEEKEARRKRYWEHFKHTVIDKNYQIIDRVKKAEREGKKINPDENPVYFLEERNYIGGKIKAIFETNFNKIYSTLNENEIAWTDFGEVLFYERISAGDRSDVANPRGITPDAARELLAKMEAEYGAERWAIIKEQVEAFRKEAKVIVTDAYEAGLYKPELYKQMQENPAYVSFQVLDYIENGMTSRVYKSLGTLKDIANPADSTMLKVISTIRAAERNRTTQQTVKFLKENFADEIKEANYTASKKGRFPIPSKKVDEELITVFEKGVMKGYYVDPYIAETINNQSYGQNAPIVPAIRFMNQTFFRPLFIQFNLGFQTMNLLRDFVRFYKNQPQMTLIKAIKRYGESFRISKIRAFGLPKNPSKLDLEAFDLLTKAEGEGVLGITFNDIISGRLDTDLQVEKILAGTGIKEFQPKPTMDKLPRWAKPTARALDKAGILDVTGAIMGFIENLGNLIETLPKAAGIYEYQGTTEEFLSKEQKSFIRRKIGSPDFQAGGTYKPITNEVFLFSNAIIQGIRSDIEVAVEPKTRSGWWWKTAKIAFIPKILMMAVLYGAFGDEYKEEMENASEYDRTNYHIIPMGRDENGKVIYFRMPVDETSRFLGGVWWKAMTMATGNGQNIGRDLMDIASYTGGNIPSVSPAITVTGATLQYLSGQNPYDAFRGRQVISDTVFEAGGADSAKAFTGWLFQQLGGGIFYKFYHEPTPPRDESTAEKFFNLPVLGNILGRFVRVSDYGKLEELRSIEAEVSKEQAKETLAERKLVNDYVRQAQEENIKFNTRSLEQAMIKDYFDGNPKTKEDLQKADRLVKKFKLQLKRGSAEPEVTALIDANTNDAKAAILKSIREDMTDAEFATLRRDLISSGVVPVTVFEKLNLDI